MRFLLRQVKFLILLALMVASPLLAQENSTITVVGSGIAQPVFQALVNASSIEADFSFNVTGTNTGFNQFCSDEANITIANRRITPEEATNCNTNNITYFESLFGHNIDVIIVNPSVTFADCLTIEQVNLIFAPSAQSTTWSQVIEGAEETPLSVFASTDNTAAYAILDKVVEGDGIRSDASLESNAEAIITAVSENAGAVGVVTLPEALAAGESVKLLSLDAAEIAGCRTPNADNVENDLYPLADRLYAYVNITSLSKPSLTEILEYVASDASVSVVEEQNSTPPTANALQANRDVLQAAVSGEPIVLPAAEFVAPTGVVGNVNLGGAAVGYDFIQASISAFNVTNPEITINTSIEGQPSGFRRLCNGEIDIMIAYSDLSEEERTNCEANNITILPVDLGNQAVVLLGNAGNDYLTCLTTEEIVTAWGVTSSDTITTWNQFNETFPETAITLFAPSLGNSMTDLLLTSASGSSVINRIDIQFNDDPLYRAAATANVDGALTLLSWSDYQQVLGNNQANVQLVSVDGGNGCITPDTSTIADGSYPLTRQAQLLMNQDPLARPEVQAFVWHVFSNENYAMLEANGFLGLRFGDLPAIRSTLQQTFSEAEIRLFEAAAEGTTEPDLEGTAEAAPEASIEATAEATTDAITESTEEANTEAAVETTQEETAEATAEASGN